MRLGLVTLLCAATVALGAASPVTEWWQKGVVYQIYPRSFQDTNGDGVGDLKGIEKRLDYLSSLGVTALWISPIFPSPMKDFGYDVSDYVGIDSRFGTLADFDALLTAVHARGMKLLLDFVPNHTSDEHSWFKESRSSKRNPKRDWYVWADPKPGGGPPNNWASNFGGSAWTLDEKTGQYYYHAFLKEQPDLNWRNPEVEKAMFDSLRFWFNRGVDGFRLDALYYLVEDPKLPDNPPNPEYVAGQAEQKRLIWKYNKNLPGMHPILRRMREVADEFAHRLLIGETYLKFPQLVAYYGTPEAPEVHLPFNFNLLKSPWDVSKIRALIHDYEAVLPSFGWPNWVLGNHDQPRLATRVGAAQARVAALLLLTLRGTPTIYQGEELGLENVPIPPELVQDTFEKNEPGRGNGRDPERTPMPWDASALGAFTTGKPWLPLGEKNLARNVKAEERDSHSMLALYRRLLALRAMEPALSVGHYVPIATPDPVLVYERRHDRDRFVVALNFSAEPREVKASALLGKIALSTSLGRENEKVAGKLRLGANEGVVIRRSPAKRAH